MDMKNRLKVLLLTLCMSISLFCFAGCNSFSGNGLDFGGGTDTPYIQHSDDEVKPHYPGEDHTIPYPDSTIPSDEDWLFEADAFDETIAQYYGVRNLYTPDAQSASYLDSSLPTSIKNNRQKFNTNAVKQYEYMAKYILINLVDHYATAINDITTDRYTFFADDPTIYLEINYDTSTYRSVNAVQSRAIQTDEWTCHLNLDGVSNLDEYYANSYVSTYLSTFVPYLQIRLIETALGITTPTTLAAMVDTSNNHPTAQAQARIDAYASRISQLGIPTQNGADTINYAGVVASDVVGSAYGSATHGVFVGSVLTGFFDNVATLFPAYSRTEFCDLDAVVVFDGGTRGSPTKLNNMEYQEYYSASFFTREGTNPLANISFDIYIDSRSDIVLDVYCLYTKAGMAEYNIEYLATLNTDSTIHYYYAPEDPNDDVNFNEVVTNHNTVLLYEDLTPETRDANTFYSAYLDPTKTTFGTNGSANPMYTDSSGAYSNMTAKLNASDLWYLPSDVATKNGEVVDLSDIMVYAPDDVDCLVVIFDIQYQGGGTVDSHDNNGYAFRYLINIEGENAQDMAQAE